jgi:hypothetical protein
MASMVLVPGYRCERCKHEWMPRNKERAPKVCPSCKSPYWDRLRRKYDPTTGKWYVPEPPSN